MSFAYKRHYVPKQFIVIAAFGIISLLYYFIFFMSLVSPSLGEFFGFLIYAVGWILAIYGVYRLKNLLKNRTIVRFILLPLSIMVILTGYYTFILTSCRTPDVGPKDNNNTFCFLHSLPGDNTLPYIYARNITQNKPTALIGDWKLVDRPPIQIGAGLGILDLTKKAPNDYRAYQLVATFLQLSWVAAVFGLLFTVGLEFGQIILGIGIVSMSGTVFINSVFVWPKFFAASLVVMGCVLLFDTANKYWKRTSITAITAIGLGLLIHDGVVFTIAGLIVVLAYIWLRSLLSGTAKTKKRSFSLRPLLIGGLIALILIAPWIIYKSHNSSSDRLIKWQFAGVINPDNRSTMQTVIDSYKHISLHTWLENRKLNIKMLYVPIEKPELPNGIKALGFSGTSIKQSLGHLSIWYEENDFYIFFFAFGLLNLGWLAVFTRKNRSSITDVEKRLVWASLISIVVWVLVMFIPSSTVIHQGSYATLLIIYCLLITWLGRNKLLFPLFVIQFLLFSVLWVFGVFARYDMSLHKGMPGFLATLLLLAMYLLLANPPVKLLQKYKS